MPREPKRGTCSVCKTEKPLFDVKNMVCGSCMGKKGGRPAKAIVKKPEEPQQLPEGKKTDQTPPDVQTHPETGDSWAYLCDACNAPVRYGQHKCSCGTWIDWRGSPVQDDPHLVVCPECGAICGHSDAQVSKCPHCNFGG